MKRILAMAASFCAASFLVSGCLLKSTTQVMYVDASGGVTWAITETDVRSDANSLTDRQQEESVYWQAVQQERHPVAAGLQELGGTKLRTTVLRGEVPYTVRTEARFSGLDEVGRRLLAAVGTLGVSTVTRQGDRWEWKVVSRDPNSSGSVVEPSDGVSAVVGEFSSIKIVLVAGRFESAEGFTLSTDRRVATFDEKSVESQQEAPAVMIKLVWR